MTMDAHEADLALADAHWWLKGFHAAACSDRADDVFDAMRRLGRVRRWLQALLCGEAVMVGVNADDADPHGYRFVLTQHQLEVLGEAIAGDANDEARGRATALLVELTRRATAEREHLINPQVAF